MKLGLIAVVTAGITMSYPVLGAPILTNGSFESGSLSPGWQVVGKTSMKIATGGTDADNYYDSIRYGAIYQSFSTSPGTSYDVAFYWEAAGLPRTVLGSAVGGGATLADSAVAAYDNLLSSANFEVLGTPATGIEHESYAFTATTPFTTLIVGVENGVPGRPTAFGLDQVSVTMTPPPPSTTIVEPGSLSVLAVGVLIAAGASPGRRRGRPTC